MGDILGVHRTCLHDAVSRGAGVGLQDVVYLSYGVVHVDVRIFQPSCTINAVCAVCQEEGIAAAGADGSVCMS